MRAALPLVAAVALSACATSEERARAAAEPCARARLARQYPTPPTVLNRCYREADGGVRLNAGVVKLTDVLLDQLADEPATYALGVERPIYWGDAPASAVWWEQLDARLVRVTVGDGFTGVTICARVGDDGALDGDVIRFFDVQPFTAYAGRARFEPTPCPTPRPVAATP